MRSSIYSDLSQPACLPACLLISECVCVLIASTRGVWWVFNRSILISKPFESRQMGEEGYLGRASDGWGAGG